MSATIIDGNVVAKRLRSEIANEAEKFTNSQGFPPGLGVILVGDDPASAQYVRMKRRACKRVGFNSVVHLLPLDVTQEEVLAKVNELNNDPQIHGILVQLPMPDHIDEEAILSAVSLEKDVDGFHPINIGALAMKGRKPSFTPATPTGCMELLKDVGVELSGANAVVLGRSNIVGLPMAMMLLKANATVTICHSRTKDMVDKIKQADVLIAAIGKPNFVKSDWLKEGVVIIDVGTNRVEDDTERGYHFVGDVDFDAALPIADAITKVPGGVGPLTITMLLSNTMKAANRSINNE